MGGGKCPPFPLHSLSCIETSYTPDSFSKYKYQNPLEIKLDNFPTFYLGMINCWRGGEKPLHILTLGDIADPVLFCPDVASLTLIYTVYINE